MRFDIAIVDDHKIVRDGLKLMFLGEESTNIIFEAADGKELLEQLQSKLPDVIVLDISMPGKSGVELTKIIKEKYPEIKILILSANDDSNTIINAIENGASGFLSKESSKEELIKAIISIMDGEDYFGESISKTIYNIFVNKLNSKDEKPKVLSEREEDIIRHFSDGLTYKQIGDLLFISPRTVETHKRNIMKKLNLNSTVDLVKYAIINKLIEL